MISLTAATSTLWSGSVALGLDGDAAAGEASGCLARKRR